MRERAVFGAAFRRVKESATSIADEVFAIAAPEHFFRFHPSFSLSLCVVSAWRDYTARYKAVLLYLYQEVKIVWSAGEKKPPKRLRGCYATVT
jgi:hypothetical protein